MVRGPTAGRVVCVARRAYREQKESTVITTRWLLCNEHGNILGIERAQGLLLHRRRLINDQRVCHVGLRRLLYAHRINCRLRSCFRNTLACWCSK
jgi:hypothetical protein